MKSLLLLAFTLQLTSCYVSANKSSEEADDEERLMNLMLSQSKYRRPVLSTKDNVTVTLGITLHQIIDVVEKHQILKLSLFIRQKWTNPLLRWNLSEYGGIPEINVDPSFLWKPDIYLYNNAAEDKDGAQDKMRTYIQVDHNGTNKWLAPTILQSSCKINVQYFPFDEQTCELKFGSWTYDARRVDLEAESSSADLRGFQVNGEWDLVEFPCQRNVELYKCCPDPYSDITCKLKIRRRTTFFFVNLIVPCFLVTLLSLLSFFLPSEAGERITLVITNLLALTVFMLLVADILPQTSEVVPLISIYFTSVLIEISLSLVATCIVLKCYFGNPTISEVPLWVRCVVMRGIAKLVRVKVKRNRREEQRNDTISDNDKKSNRPVSFSESLDRNCNRCHHRLTKDHWPEAGGFGMLDDHLNVRSCGVCRERNFELLHLTNGLNSRLISRCQSRNSLRRDSWFSDVSPPNENNLNADTQSQTSLISALLHQQEHLVQHVYKLVKAVQKQEQHDDKREDWILVAEILDTFFFYIFIVLTVSSTFFIFAIGTRW